MKHLSRTHHRPHETRRFATGAGRVVVFAMLLSLAIEASASAADSDLDTTLQGTGKYAFPIAIASVASVSVDPQDRILLSYTFVFAATNTNFGLLRVPDSGMVNPCGFWGIDNGSTNADYVYGSAATPIALTGGKRLTYLVGSAAGANDDPRSRAFITAVDASCSIDPGFNFHQAVLSNDPSHHTAGVRPLWVPENDGSLKVLMVITSGILAVVRTYDDESGASIGVPDGTISPNDANVGPATLDLTALVRQPDGKILVVGSITHQGDTDALVVRLDAQGPDPSFGVNGYAVFSFDEVDSGEDRVNGATALPDGRIVVVGSVERPSGTEAAVAILGPGGAPSSDFGEAGRYSFDFGPSAELNVLHGVVVQPDGKIVVAGGAGPDAFIANYDVVVARLRTTGPSPLDATFGTNGLLKVPFDLGGTLPDEATSIVLDRAGRIVLGGLAIDSNGDTKAIFVRLKGAGGFADGFEIGLGTWSGSTP